MLGKQAMRAQELIKKVTGLSFEDFMKNGSNILTKRNRGALNGGARNKAITEKFPSVMLVKGGGTGNQYGLVIAGDGDINSRNDRRVWKGRVARALASKSVFTTTTVNKVSGLSIPMKVDVEIVYEDGSKHVFPMNAVIAYGFDESAFFYCRYTGEDDSGEKIDEDIYIFTGRMFANKPKELASQLDIGFDPSTDDFLPVSVSFYPPSESEEEYLDDIPDDISNDGGIQDAINKGVGRPDRGTGIPDPVKTSYEDPVDDTEHGVSDEQPVDTPTPGVTINPDGSRSIDISRASTVTGPTWDEMTPEQKAEARHKNILKRATQKFAVAQAKLKKPGGVTIKDAEDGGYIDSKEADALYKSLNKSLNKSSNPVSKSSGPTQTADDVVDNQTSDTTTTQTVDIPRLTSLDMTRVSKYKEVDADAPIIDDIRKKRRMYGDKSLNSTERNLYDMFLGYLQNSDVIDRKIKNGDELSSDEKIIYDYVKRKKTPPPVTTEPTKPETVTEPKKTSASVDRTNAMRKKKTTSDEPKTDTQTDPVKKASIERSEKMRKVEKTVDPVQQRIVDRMKQMRGSSDDRTKAVHGVVKDSEQVIVDELKKFIKG